MYMIQFYETFLHFIFHGGGEYNKTSNKPCPQAVCYLPTMPEQSATQSALLHIPVTEKGAVVKKQDIRNNHRDCYMWNSYDKRKFF